MRRTPKPAILTAAQVAATPEAQTLRFYAGNIRNFNTAIKNPAEEYVCLHVRQEGTVNADGSPGELVEIEEQIIGLFLPKGSLADIGVTDKENDRGHLIGFFAKGLRESTSPTAILPDGTRVNKASGLRADLGLVMLARKAQRITTVAKSAVQSEGLMKRYSEAITALKSFFK